MRKLILLLVLSAVLPSVLVANQLDKYEFINKYRDIVIEVSRNSRIPASIIMAQAIVESRYGTSPLAVEANNLHGHKVRPREQWANGDYAQYDDDKDSAGRDTKSKFRRYNSPEESFRQHAIFLKTGSTYKNLFQLEPTDYVNWAHGLKKAGYATDPTYPYKLINKIEEDRLFELDEQAWVSTAGTKKSDRWYTSAKPEPTDDQSIGDTTDTATEAPYYIVAENQFKPSKSCDCYSTDDNNTLFFSSDMSIDLMARYTELLAKDRVRCPDFLANRGQHTDTDNTQHGTDNTRFYIPAAPPQRTSIPYNITPSPVLPEPPTDEFSLPSDIVTEDIEWGTDGDH